MKSWVRGVTVVGLAAAVMSFPLAARAGDAHQEKKAAKEGEEYYQGVVSAVDFKAGTVSVKQKDAGSMTFQAAPGSKYFVKEKKDGAMLTDFKVGNKVEVWYVVDRGTPTIRTLAEEGSHAEHRMKKDSKGQ